MSSIHLAAAQLASIPAAAGLPPRLSELLQPLVQYDWRDLGYSLGVVLVGWLVGTAAAALSLRALKRWSRKTDSILDDAIVRHLRRPIRWLLPVMVVRLLLPLVSAPDDFRPALEKLLLIAVIAGIGWLLLKAINVLDDVVMARYDVNASDNLKARAVRTQLSGLRNIAGFLVIVLTVAFVLLSFESVRQLGAGLLASAGVAGIVLGFAAQRSIATVLAGLQIALTQPIRVEDVVIVEGEWGHIEEITLTYVVVRIWDLRRLVVPITYFIEKPFQNWTRTSATILGTVNLQLDYSVPVEEIRTEFKRILDESSLWDQEVWGVQVTDCSEQTMTLRPLMSAKNSGDAWDLRCLVREGLLTFVQKNYPHALPRQRAEVSGVQVSSK